MADDKTNIDKKSPKGDKVASGKDSDDKAAKKASAPSKASAAPVKVTFAGNIDIYPQSHLPKYDSLENKAYKAISTGRASDNLIAIVCEKNLIPRRNAASIYTSIINPGLLPVVAYGKVYWPPAKQERYIIVYRRVVDSRLLEPDQPKAMGWKQDDVMELIVKPMVNILQDFRDKDFVHGAIRPSNMFQSLGGKSIVLGDCLSAQPSYTQPSLFEPIERAQADPVSRGKGTLPDDIYAFGVSLAVMMRSQDPLDGKSDEEVIAEKIKNGSYAAVTGKDRFKGSILELLRGVLHDDPTQRWTIDEVLVWLDGRRLSPKQSLPRKKAARPISFAGDKFLQTSLLAMTIDKHPLETVKFIEDGTLEQWLTRSLEDMQMVDRLQEAYSASVQMGRGPGYEDRLVANVASILDTMGPIRFRGMRIAGDGVGGALYDAMMTKKDIKVFADMFMHSIAMNWVTANENPNLDVTGLISKFDSCRNFIRQNKMGFGVERCLYSLSSEAPCLSAKLKDYIVTSPEDLMYAFETICEKGESPRLFIDRHSAAFLSVKDSKIIDSYLFDLNSPEDHKNVLGNLKTLATIQKRSKLGKFPHIAKAINKRLPVVYKRFHDEQVREKLKEGVDKFVKTGDLVKMANLLDSPDVHEKDFRGFKEAMAEHAQLQLEHDRLEHQLKDEASFGRATGREFSALISGGLAALIILVTAFMFLSNKSIL